jgi:hypothetical protein
MAGTHRTPLARTHHGALITAQALSLYRRAVDLRRRGADKETVHTAEADLERLLGGGRRPFFETTIFDVYRFQEPGDPVWERKVRLRRQLDAAVRELKRQEREAQRAARAARHRTPKSGNGAPDVPASP